MHALDAVRATNAASGLLLAALGLWVLRLRWRSWTNVAFAAYALAFAGAVEIQNLLNAPGVGHRSATSLAVETSLYVVIIVALLGLAARVPRLASRRDLAWGLVAAVAALGTYLIRLSAFDLFMGATAGALLFVALRWRSYESSAERSGAAFVSAGLALWWAFHTGATVLGRTSLEPHLLARVALLGLVAAAWLWNSSRGGGRGAAMVSWAILISALAGMIEATAFRGASDLWGFTVARVAGIALIAYSIVRHQSLGMDVKLRFTISKSTVAAVFIAVFFVASEAAQQFFGDQLESGYLGILAAGALVFALAPLSRLADRIAEKAVPATVASGNDAHEEAYKAAVRLALRGGITRREELELARIADAHGISALRAHRLREEVERVPGESA